MALLKEGKCKYAFTLIELASKLLNKLGNKGKHIELGDI